MRDILPLRRLLQEVWNQLNMDFASPTTMYYIVFEENNASLRLDTSPRKTPRMRQFSAKYHFFVEHIGEGKGVMIHRVESKNRSLMYLPKGYQKKHSSISGS